MFHMLMWAPVDVGTCPGSKACKFSSSLSTALRETITYVLHNFYNWSARMRVYWLKMKAQQFSMIGIATGMAAAIIGTQGQPLVVHEWGTFTSLQDEAGRTLGGINTDDEPVPSFCHDLDGLLIVQPGELPPVTYKGVASCHPDVTMRLETPVLYFHPPSGTSSPLTASVKVAFRGGWLTQFYPAAEPGGFSRSLGLTERTTGTLTWNDLKLGADVKGPETTERVWTAPRAVQAASVSATNGEGEKFLFYRGVGHLVCPLQVKRSADSTMLEGRAQVGTGLSNCQPMTVQHLWLASFGADGACAFRSLAPVNLAGQTTSPDQGALFTVPARFARNEYSAAKLSHLRVEMRAALQGEGLFADEADALLNTWELSYFKSPGLRLFFIVPRAWTDWHLLLDISVPCEIKRAMVGRLELVTPEQRVLLKELAKAPVPTKPWAYFDMDGSRPVTRGTMPPAYHDLGRFRNALLLNEYEARPTPSLKAFIRINGLEGNARARTTVLSKAN
jgi:hypothetical protein